MNDFPLFDTPEAIERDAAERRRLLALMQVINTLYAVRDFIDDPYPSLEAGETVKDRVRTAIAEYEAATE